MSKMAPRPSFQDTIAKMESILAAEGELRSQRPDLTWIELERKAMHAAVNAERRRNGLPPVDLAAVERKERLAVGHTDYAHKLALYCAELCVEGRNRAP